MANKEEDFSWIITPLLGAAGLLAAYIFSGASNNTNNQSQNLPPPPPPNTKPGGCGCNKG